MAVVATAGAGAQTPGAQTVRAPSTITRKGAVHAGVDSTSLGRGGSFRRPFWVMMRSAAVPGWGQAYNRRWLKMILFGGVESGFIYGVVHEAHLASQASRKADEQPDLRYEWQVIANNHRATRTDYTWWGAFSLLLSMGDAFVDAHLRGFNVEFEQAGDSASALDGPGSGRPAVQLSYRVRF